MEKKQEVTTPEDEISTEKGGEVEKQEESKEIDYKTEYEKAKADSEKYREINKKLEKDNKTNFEELKKLRGEKNKLSTKDVLKTLDSEKRKELEDLKYSDPDAFADKIADLKAEIKEGREKEIAKKEQEVQQADFFNQVESAISDLEAKNPDIHQVLRNVKGELKLDEIAKIPGLSEKLEGKSIKKQVELAYEALKNRTVKNPKTMEQPNLSKVGGSSNKEVSKKPQPNEFSQLQKIQDIKKD